MSACTPHGELVYEPFARDHIVLIVAAQHPWADGRTVTPADLLTEPFILRESTAAAYELMAEGLARHNLAIEHLQAVLTLASAEAIEMSVEAGIGVAAVTA